MRNICQIQSQVVGSLYPSQDARLEIPWINTTGASAAASLAIVINECATAYVTQLRAFTSANQLNGSTRYLSLFNLNSYFLNDPYRWLTFKNVSGEHLFVWRKIKQRERDPLVLGRRIEYFHRLIYGGESPEFKGLASIRDAMESLNPNLGDALL